MIGKIAVLALLGAVAIAAASPAGAATFIHSGNPNTFAPAITTPSLLDDLGSGMAAGGTGIGSAGEIEEDGWTSVMLPRMFPLDATTAGAPEPGAWALMLAGFGVAGTLLRSRRRSPLTAR